MLQFVRSTSAQGLARLFLMVMLALFALLTSSCAAFSPPLSSVRRTVAQDQADPPQRELPESTRQPCPVLVLGPTPSYGDLQAGFVIRGAQVYACAIQKDLAVATHDKEHTDELEWKRQRVRRSCPWWRFGICRAD